MKTKLKIDAYTDGSCLGNPGVGGYASIMLAKGKKKRVCGTCPKMTTNNRTELMAVIGTVKWCNEVQKEPCEITAYTDSNYIILCSKKTRKELTSPDRPNNDLWQELITEGNKGNHHITFVKIEGHNGHQYNEEADKLAKEMAVKARHEMYDKLH